MFEYIDTLKDIATQAGSIIMSYYNKSINVVNKKDMSPVTDADIASNQYIVGELKKLFPNIAIISEEEQEKKLLDHNDNFWLVDPLDGTKGFLSKNDQFSVNIALIKNRKPILGLIYIPVKNELYYNDPKNAYKQIGNKIKKINAKKFNKDNPIIVTSINTKCLETKNFIDQFNPHQIINMSSAIKFCLIAEGIADVYPRFRRTMEWDSAAGHAIVNSAGGKVVDANYQELVYAKPFFENKGFIVYGSN